MFQFYMETQFSFKAVNANAVSLQLFENIHWFQRGAALVKIAKNSHYSCQHNAPYITYYITHHFAFSTVPVILHYFKPVTCVSLLHFRCDTVLYSRTYGSRTRTRTWGPRTMTWGPRTRTTTGIDIKSKTQLVTIICRLDMGIKIKYSCETFTD